MERTEMEGTSDISSAQSKRRKIQQKIAVLITTTEKYDFALADRHNTIFIMKIFQISLNDISLFPGTTA
jgi:hypothetical protein